MINKQLEELKKYISESNHIVIAVHNNPDGDAIGSSLALYNYLINFKENITVISPNSFPENMLWMKGADKILIYNKNVNIANTIIASADLIFCLDFNALHRVEKMENVMKVSHAKKVLIDHHLQPEIQNFDLCFSVIDISSTAELIYNIISQLHTDVLIDKYIAECIYVGIITDTGSFSYSCNYDKTFSICAELLKKGIDAEKIHRLIYDTFSEKRLRLLGHCLSEKLVVNQKLSTAYIWLTKDELSKYDYQVGDTEGVVNYALSIKNIELAALFTERDNVVRISFRSKGKMDVNNFARIHFNGGGHKNASGATSHKSLDETILHFNSCLASYENILTDNYDEVSI